MIAATTRGSSPAGWCWQSVSPPSRRRRTLSRGRADNATAGRFVIRRRRPTGQLTDRSGSSTVHTFTARPAVGAHRLRRDTGPRVDRHAPRCHRRGDRVDRFLGAQDEVARREVRGDGAHVVERGEVEAAHEDLEAGGDLGDQLDRRAGELAGRVPPRFGGRVLDLDVDAHPRHHTEGRLQPGDRDRNLVVGQVGNGPPVGQDGVVVDDEDAVGRGADVELDPVGTLCGRTGERVERVLRKIGRCTPMPDDHRHVQILSNFCFTGL